MSDPSREVDTMQHKEFEKDLTAQAKRIDEMYGSWGNFLESQERRAREFEDRFFAEIKELRGGVDRKAELDGVLLNKVAELGRRVEYLVVKKEKNDEAQRYLVVYFREIRDILKSVDLRKMKNDIEAAHSWKRDHEEHHSKALEPRIQKLETRGGKAALRILWGIGLPVGGAAAFLLFQKLLSFLSPLKGGTP